MKSRFPIIILFCFWSCTQIREATDAILKPSAREIYARDFDKESHDFRNWEEAYENAKSDSLSVSEPFVMAGKFHPDNNFVYNYNLLINKGERVFVEVLLPDSARIFIEVFEQSDFKLIAQSEIDQSVISTAVENAGVYKVLVQPEIGVSSDFVLKIYTQPVYGFPVAGAGNKNIQSFWGANRNGGSRTHEGVDIFAPRGTPVIAATDGRIGFTGERGLGGKQVWLRDGNSSNSLYYAHLDSIMTNSGQKVEKGDTLGTVGNTGNAIHTAPHLHFGIYSGYGAIDPLLFIKEKPIPETVSEFNSQKAKVVRKGSELRIGPSVQNTQIGSLNEKDTVFLLGKSNSWFQVSVSDSLNGFIHQSLVKVTD